MTSKMTNFIKLKFLVITTISICSTFFSCKKTSDTKEFQAYFGGEVTNPSSDYVLFCKDAEVIDSVKLDKNNRFFMSFDSLSPGLYSFKNEPEYQYVYFDKNDSIMVHIDAKDFDNSLAFCGRGDQKNNFLMELYLKNEADKNKMFTLFDYDFDKFNKVIDSTHVENTKFYQANKEEIKWSDEFDKFAKASLDFNYYTKKELYPKVHGMRTGNDVYETIPNNYYDFRKSINFNDDKLCDYAPFIMYVSHMLNNKATILYHNHLTEVDKELKTNINKLNIVDTLIKNEKVKNKILNNIAFQYLLEDQNVVNNNIFIDKYYKLSSDKSHKNEILKIGNAIQLLRPNFELPIVNLIDVNGKTISSDQLFKRETVIFFWTQKLSSHLEATHKKLLSLRQKYPNYQYVAVNLDKNQDAWTKTLSKYKFDGIREYRCIDFEDLKAKWAITKVHRTIILGKKGLIKNAFTNIFDVKFEEELK